MLAQQLTNGLVLGSIYALASLGFTLIYGAARVVNFAYGEMLMLGAFVTLMVMNVLGIEFFLALPLAMATARPRSASAHRQRSADYYPGRLLRSGMLRRGGRMQPLRLLTNR